METSLATPDSLNTMSQDTKMAALSCWDACCIVPNLFLGNATAAVTRSSREVMRTLCIGAIVNVTEGTRIGIGNEFADEFAYLHVDIHDEPGTNIRSHFEAVSGFIDRHQAHATRPGVLVHCVAGSSRSATLFIAHLMRSKSMPLEQAYRHVCSCRPCVDPNDGFRRQLMDYEQHLFGRTTLDLLQTPERQHYAWRFVLHAYLGVYVWSKLKMSQWWWDAGADPALARPAGGAESVAQDRKSVV
jgi:predicted protein tyrosine phosphatase